MSYVVAKVLPRNARRGDGDVHVYEQPVRLREGERIWVVAGPFETLGDAAHALRVAVGATSNTVV